MTQTAQRTVLGFVTILIVVGSAAAWFLVGSERAGERDVVLVDDVGDRTAAPVDSGHVVEEASTVLDVLPPVLANTPDDDEARSNHAPVRVSARVVDESGAPLAGSTFVLASGVPGSDTVELFEHVADSDGRVSFDVTGSRAASMARRTTPETITVTADGHQTMSTTIECGAISHLALGDIALARGLYLTGRVVDAYDHPIAGATVLTRRTHRYGPSLSYHLARSSVSDVDVPPITTISDEHGHFTIATSTKGYFGQPSKAHLEVIAAGFAPHFSSHEITETAGTVEIGYIAVDSGWTLRGVVRSASHGPAAGAYVIVSRTRLDSDHYTKIQRATPAPGGTSIDNNVWWTTTDERGNFHFDRMAERTFTLYVVAEHGVHRRTKIKVDSTPLDVLLDDFEPQTFQFVDGLTGRPIAPGRVAAHFGTTPNDPFAETNSPFRFPATADADDPTRWLIPRPKWFAPAMFVDLEGYRASPRRSGTTLTLERQAQLEVHVTSDEGLPIENAAVFLRRIDENDRKHDVSQVYSDVNGVASFGETSAGRHEVTIEAAGYAFFTKVVDLSSDSNSLHEQLTPTSQLIVRIRDADGEPVPAGCLDPAHSPNIYTWAEGAAIDDTLSTRDEGAYENLMWTIHSPHWTGPGTFTFDRLAPGRYHVEYEPGGIVNVEIPQHATVNVDLTLRRWPLVSGIALNNGRPIAGAHVTSESALERGLNLLVSYGERAPELTPSSATTDAEGRWSMPMQPGSRYVIARLGNAATTESLHTLELDERYDVVHELSSRPLSGIVTTPSGEPIAEATVFGKPNGGTTTTDDEGRFELPFTGTDMTTLAAYHADYIRPTPTETTSLASPIHLELAPGAQLTFHFESDTGEPLSPQRLKNHMVWVRNIDVTSHGGHVGIDNAVNGGRTHVARGVPPGRYRLSVVKTISRGVTETVVTEDVNVTDATPIERTIVVPVIP